MEKGYDNAAPFYDQLSRLVFGSSLLMAQRWLVQHIPPSASILIVGGGTGIILEEIAAIHGCGLAIDYIEIAPKMMARARRRQCANNRVNFIEAAVQDVDFAVKEYDVVITAFLFDSFTEQRMQTVFSAIDRALTRDGRWFYSDFVDTGKPLHKMLLWSMYSFFRLLGSIQVSQLPGINTCFTRHYYKRTASQTYRNGFIEAVIYQRR